MKLMRSRLTEELLSCPDAFYLLSVIAFRARYHDGWNPHNLKPGQSLIGHGRLTARRYRTAKATLEKAGLATFEATSKYCVATITDSRVYDLNIGDGDKQADNQGDSLEASKESTERQASVKQATTERQQTKKERSKEGKNPSSAPSAAGVELEESGDHKNLIECWHDAFQAHFDQAYKFNGGRDGKAVKELLKFAGSPEAVMAVATAAWSNLGGFLLQQASTLSGLAGKWNEIQVAVKVGAKSGAKLKPVAMRPVDKDPEGGDLTEQFKQRKAV